jgi:RNA polymerase sigma-70 factor (ECF subfamily)
LDDWRLVEDAIRGDQAATRALVRLLLPVVQVRVARTLVRRRRDDARDVRADVEDLSQDVFAALFADDARLLRAWDPARGLSLVNFCGLIAEREALSLLRSGRRSPFTETATELEDIERDVEPVPDAELRVASKEQLLLVVDRLREALSPRGLELFYRLIVDEEAVEAVCASTGMTPDAVYAWRSRLGKLLRKIIVELSDSKKWDAARDMSDPSTSVRNPQKKGSPPARASGAKPEKAES